MLLACILQVISMHLLYNILMAQLKKKGCRSICPLANILDIIGDRWTLLVIRDLLFLEKHEFHEFLNAGEGISTNILAARLKRLMASDIAHMRPHPTNKRRKLYYLTQKSHWIRQSGIYNEQKFEPPTMAL